MRIKKTVEIPGLGAKIREARLEARLSIDDVRKLTRIGQNSYYQLERDDDTFQPSQEQIEAIAELLDLSIPELTGEVDLSQFELHISQRVFRFPSGVLSEYPNCAMVAYLSTHDGLLKRLVSPKEDEPALDFDEDDDGTTYEGIYNLPSFNKFVDQNIREFYNDHV